MSAAKDIPVLIAGAGPVGLSLAIELGRLGVTCLLVEKRDGSVPVPKMSQVSARNMEFCRRWGIAEEVRDAVWPSAAPQDFVYVESLAGRELSRMKVAAFSARDARDFTPIGAAPCPQNYFDPILMKRVRAEPAVTFRTDTALESFIQDEGGVAARLRDAGGGRAETVRATYLVGCDGFGGVVRQAAGIPLGGRGALVNSLNVFFRAPDLLARHDKGLARMYRFIDETGCWGEMIAIDGRALWRLTVFDDDASPLGAEGYLRKLMGADFPFELISVMRWERRDGVAERYRAGNVFIAGDAAHQCSPTAGLGMHTGIEEAVNLAWKLAAALAGWAGPRLLDSYEAERRPVALRNVAMATHAYGIIDEIPPWRPVAEGTPEAEEQRRRFAAFERVVSKFSTHESIKTQYAYEDSPVCIGDGVAAPAPVWGRYTPSTVPGSRAPHAWIADGVSTLDLYGDGFVLLRLGEGAPDAAPLAEAARARGVPLETVALADPAIAELYERRLVLVRPDGHVAWRGDACPADPLAVVDRVRGA